jgi:hypothetical protein
MSDDASLVAQRSANTKTLKCCYVQEHKRDCQLCCEESFDLQYSSEFLF